MIRSTTLAEDTAGSPEMPKPAPSVPPSIQLTLTAYLETMRKTYVQEGMCNLDRTGKDHL